MARRPITTRIALILAALLIANVAQAQQITAGLFVERTLEPMQQFADAVLARPDVADEDKTLIRAQLKKWHDVGDKVIKDAGGPDVAFSMEVQAQLAAIQREFSDFLYGRLDFYWFYQQGLTLQHFEPVMLESKPDVYLDLMKFVELDDAHMAQARQILAELAADLDKLKTAAASPPATDSTELQKRALAANAEKQARIAKSRAALRKLLTPDQQARFDWKFPQVAQGTVIAGTAPAGPRPVCFSKQVAMIKAPEAGTYSLQVMPTTKAEPQKLFTTTLKTGDQVGFRMTDKGVEAFTDKQAVPLPEADKVYLWTWEPAKP